MIKVNLLPKHLCKGKLPHIGFGNSITTCIESDDSRKLWVLTNGNVLIQVNYCPYCGKEALIKIGE